MVSGDDGNPRNNIRKAGPINEPPKKRCGLPRKHSERCSAEPEKSNGNDDGTNVCVDDNKNNGYGSCREKQKQGQPLRNYHLNSACKIWIWKRPRSTIANRRFGHRHRSLQRLDLFPVLKLARLAPLAHRARHPSMKEMIGLSRPMPIPKTQRRIAKQLENRQRSNKGNEQSKRREIEWGINAPSRQRASSMLALEAKILTDAYSYGVGGERNVLSGC